MLQRNLTRPAVAGVIAVGAFALGRFSGRPDTPRPPSPARGEAQVVAMPPGASLLSPPAEARRAEVDRLAAAIRTAHAAPDRAARLYEFALRLRDLAPAHYPALLQALRRARGPETPELMAMLCSLWAAHDGAAAFAAARALVGSDGEFGALHSAIAAWAQRDPHGAQEALRAAGLTDLATDEMAAFVQGWARRDPGGAEAFLATASGAARPDGDEIPAAVRRGFEAIAAGRIEADPAAAMAWFGRLPAGVQEQLRQAVLAKLAAVAPAEASAWLARDPTAQVGASDLVSLLRGMQLSGFDQQFAWAQTAAHSETRQSALQAVVREAAQTNLVGLGEWLAARADDAALTPAFSAYAAQVVHKSPNAAVTWALSLDQPALRQQALNTVAMEWITVNPRAAREWALRTRLVDWETLAR